MKMLSRVIVTAFVGLVAAAQGICQCPPVPVSTCSYTALNGSCTLYIDRMNAATPPTIYARRGSVITVVVGNASPFETLTLDEQSIKSTPPTDSFQSVFGAVSPTLQKLTFVNVIKPLVVVPGVEVADPVEVIQNQQKKDSDDIGGLSNVANDAVAAALAQVKIALQPPPGNVCAVPSPPSSAPWLNTANWKSGVSSNLQTAISQIATNESTAKDIADRIDTLDNQINALTGHQLQSTIDKLTSNQAALRSNLNAVLSKLEPFAAKLTALKAAVDAIPGTGPGLPATNNAIIDSLLHDRNDELETWALNSVNILAAPAKQFTAAAPADPFTALVSAADITTPPAKTAVVTLAVQYMTAPRFEVSSGVMVPTMPFHSYAAAASTADPTKTIVQQSLTYTVVPTANVNFLIKEFMTRQRAAFFETTAVGYNPTTSAVEFGEGLTFSWKSIEFSALADIGRDTSLAKGFSVNGPLASSTSKPGTTTDWEVKPAFAISIRLPIGGSSSSGGSGH